ncbi:MAG: MATE family efflux transporter [Clostridiales bacterium]|nr:MATE family efflux transporter [Clostridiales bacterium]
MNKIGGLSPEKIDLFENYPISKAVLKLALPTIVGQLVAMIYNLADTYFVGQLNDPNQVAAVSLCFPAAMTMTALSNFFGIGGGSLFSRCLGSREYDKARKSGSFCFYSMIAAALVYSIVFLLFMNPILRLLGASDATIGYCRQYVFWIVVVGALPSMLSVMLGSFVRAEGASKQASIGVTIGGVINIILDPVFIFPFGLNMQLEGAAIATMISNCAGLAYFLVYIRRSRSKTLISLSPRDFTTKGGIASGVAKTGLPALIQSMLPVVSNTMLHNFVAAYDDFAIAAIGIVKKIDVFAMNVTFGMSQGVLPLLAYNYASGNFERLRKARKFAFVCSVAFCLVCIAVFQSFPEQAVSIFIKDAKTIGYGTAFLRIQSLSTPFMAINFMTVSTFQATGHTKQTLIMTLLRKGLPDIPLLFLMDALIPLYGLMWIQPILDGSASVVAFILFAKFTRSMKEVRAKSRDGDRLRESM